MDVTTARKYIRLSTLPSESHRIRGWRTRSDPLAGVWERVVGQLQRNPTISATAVLNALLVADPESLSETQLRTLQRRIKDWKKNNASELGVIPDPQVPADGVFTPAPLAPLQPPEMAPFLAAPDIHRALSRPNAEGGFPSGSLPAEVLDVSKFLGSPCQDGSFLFSPSTNAVRGLPRKPKLPKR
jgi:hypothetical protein